MATTSANTSGGGARITAENQDGHNTCKQGNAQSAATRTGQTMTLTRTTKCANQPATNDNSDR